MKISRRAELAPFEVMSIVGRVAELEAAGREVFPLCVGQPPDGAPEAVHERARTLHAEGARFGYSAPLGTPALREAIADHTRRWYGHEVDPGSVAVTTGASGAFLAVFLTAFDPGDRVGVVRPGYPAYANLLGALGIEPVEIPVGVETGYQPTVELLEAAHRRGPLNGLILAAPANPTGSTIERDELTELITWCGDRGIRFVSDEIYHGIVDGGSARPGICARGIDDRSVVVSSFSKYWGMTGWRLGWALLPDDLVGPIDAVAGNAALCAPVPAQEAAMAAFEERTYVECDQRVDRFIRARNVLAEGADDLGWGPSAPADGAFYLWVDVADRLGPHPDTTAWCRALLEDTGVAFAPGRDFDRVDGDRFVRISHAVGPDAVRDALDRVADWQERTL